jgi:hypothetical protein
VIVTEHVPPAERGHVVETKLTLPVPPVWEKVIVSPVTGAVKPVTVAVQVEVAVTAKLFGTQDTAVAVTFLFAQVTPCEFELPEWSVSPPYVAVIVTVPRRPLLGV